MMITNRKIAALATAEVCVRLRTVPSPTLPVQSSPTVLCCNRLPVFAAVQAAASTQGARHLQMCHAQVPVPKDTRSICK